MGILLIVLDKNACVFVLSIKRIKFSALQSLLIFNRVKIQRYKSKEFFNIKILD